MGALNVDQESREDTYKAVLGSKYQEDFEKELGIPEKFKSQKKI